MRTESKSWTQRLFDWEKSRRCLSALEEHCRLAGLAKSDTALLLCLSELGHRDEEGNSYWYFSVREAAQRSRELSADFRRQGDVTTEAGRRYLQLAAQAKLSAGGITKSIRRLGVARRDRGELELVRYHDSLEGDRRCKRLIVSWKRVFALETWGASARFDALRPSQEKKDNYLPSPSTKNQEPYHFEDCDPWEAMQRQHARQVDRLAKRILNALAPIEARHDVAAEDRLSWHSARLLALGICDDPDSGTAEELDRIFASLSRREVFTASPAAYLMQCGKRRRWINRKASSPPVNLPRELSARSEGNHGSH